MNVIAVYPGRFHPFHRGHASSFKQLADQFGLENTYLAISAKQEMPKSPFTAIDRAKMAMSLGIPKENIMVVKNPYSAQEYIARAEQLGLDPNDTALVFAVSKKDMEGDPSLGIPPDPRFTFQPKKDGSPSYFQPLSKNIQSPMTQHGYIKSTDVAEFPIAGQQMRDASAVRAAYMKGDEKMRNQILIDLYGAKAAKLIKPIFDANLQLTENFYRKLVELKRKIVESKQLNELHPGEHGFGPFKLYAGDAHQYHHVDTFKSLDDAIEEVRFLIDTDHNLITNYWKIVDGTGEQVWDQDPETMYDKMHSASKMQFKKPNDLNELAPSPDFGDGRRDDGEYMPLSEYADIIEQYLGRGYTREDRKGGAKHLPQVSVRFTPKDKSQDGLIIYSFIHPKRGEYGTHNTIILKYDEQGMGHGKKGPSAVPKTQKQALKIAQLISPQGVAEGLNEFAPDGFNGGDDDEGFSPEIAKMAQEDGFTKGVSLADGATLELAMKINYWHTQHGGMYKQYFAKGFKQGRMNKIKHDNKQYNLNLKLMKDGSIRHGEQGVAEGYTPSAGELARDLLKLTDDDFSKKYGMSKVKAKQHYSSSKLKEQGVAEATGDAEFDKMMGKMTEPTAAKTNLALGKGMYGQIGNINDDSAEAEFFHYGDTILEKLEQLAKKVTSSPALKQKYYNAIQENNYEGIWDMLVKALNTTPEDLIKLENIMAGSKSLTDFGWTYDDGDFATDYYNTWEDYKQSFNDLNEQESLNELAPGGEFGGGPSYFLTIARAWYHHDLQELAAKLKQSKSKSAMGHIMDAQQAVEKMLDKGIIAPDGVRRSYTIDYNSSYDGVIMYSDDYYEYGDYDGNGNIIDTRTGKPWGQYDYMEFNHDQLSSGELEEGLVMGPDDLVDVFLVGKNKKGDSVKHLIKANVYNRNIPQLINFLDSRGYNKNAIVYGPSTRQSVTANEDYLEEK